LTCPLLLLVLLQLLLFLVVLFLEVFELLLLVLLSLALLFFVGALLVQLLLLLLLLLDPLALLVQLLLLLSLLLLDPLALLVLFLSQLLRLLLLLLVELRVRRRVGRWIRVGWPRCRRTVAILARIFGLTVTTSVARLVAGTDLTRLPDGLRPFVWRDIRAVRRWILLRRHLPCRRRNAHVRSHVLRILILHRSLPRL